MGYIWLYIVVVKCGEVGFMVGLILTPDNPVDVKTITPDHVAPSLHVLVPVLMVGEAGLLILVC